MRNYITVKGKKDQDTIHHIFLDSITSIVENDSYPLRIAGMYGEIIAIDYEKEAKRVKKLILSQANKVN